MPPNVETQPEFKDVLAVHMTEDRCWSMQAEAFGRPWSGIREIILRMPDSGRKVPDKFAKAGFHAIKSEKVNAPLIDELPMALECKVKSFDDGILIGEIVNVNADESILTDGKIDPKKLKPISFDPVNNTYIGLGEVVGKAFGDGLKLK